MTARAGSTKRRAWWQPRASRKSQRLAMSIVLGLLVALAVFAWTTVAKIQSYPTTVGEGSSEPIAFEIPSGTSFPTVLEMLVERGVVPPDEVMYFRLYVLHRGAARTITAGPHAFTAAMTPEEIVEELQRQQQAKILEVTIAEGKNMLQVAQILADAGLSDAASLEAAMRDPALVASLGVPGETLEGYLFPDTYKFEAASSAADIVTKLVRRHQQVYADLKRRYRDAAESLEKRLEWGDHEIVTLASIVEKETGAKHERPLIAGVFLNRLRFVSFQPKLLQTDPTIIYGCTVPASKSAACQKFEGRIRTIHLRDTENPYNTYTHEGLPPGPISNPGRAALEAVFAPKSSRYLYFVARNDGTHQFSKTEAEHEKWVDLYQRKGLVGDQAQP